jgi:hypothetical protein
MFSVGNSTDGYGIVKTTDGVNFTFASWASKNLVNQQYGITVDGDGVLYAIYNSYGRYQGDATTNKAYRSKDGGETWTPAGTVGGATWGSSNDFCTSHQWFPTANKHVFLPYTVSNKLVTANTFSPTHVGVLDSAYSYTAPGFPYLRIK